MDMSKPHLLHYGQVQQPLKKTEFLRTISNEYEPPVSNFSDISAYMMIYKQKHQKELVLNKHEKAEDVQQMMDSFSDQAQRHLFSRRCQTALSKLDDHLGETNYNTQAIKTNTNSDLEDFDKTCQRRYDSMRARQLRELEIHEAKKPIETPPNFRRRSPQLLELYRQQRRLFFQSRFDEALQMKQECDERDAQENIQAYQNALQHWTIVRDQILEKHRKEEEILRDWISSRRTEIIQQSNWEIEALNRRKFNLNCDIRAKTSVLRSSQPHAIRRTILFDNKCKPKGTLIPITQPIDVGKLVAELPPRSREILTNY